MTRLCAGLLAVSTLAASSVANAAEVQIRAEGPVVELNIYETKQLAPDMAAISAGVTSEAATATEALRQNSIEMRRVIEQIKALGIAEEDIQTTGINLNPRFDYDRQNQRQIFRGYQVSNRVSVKLRKIEEVGEVLDALVAAGATDLNGPFFSVEDDSETIEELRAKAMHRGKQRALQYAVMAGYRDVRLLEISEALIGRGPVPMAETRVMMADVAESSAPVQPGQVSSGVSVTVKYEMVDGDSGHSS